jgi:hypothetical protein
VSGGQHWLRPTVQDAPGPRHDAACAAVGATTDITTGTATAAATRPLQRSTCERNGCFVAGSGLTDEEIALPEFFEREPDAGAVDFCSERDTHLRSDLREAPSPVALLPHRCRRLVEPVRVVRLGVVDQEFLMKLAHDETFVPCLRMAVLPMEAPFPLLPNADSPPGTAPRQSGPSRRLLVRPAEVLLDFGVL